jgi:hypothetical protein
VLANIQPLPIEALVEHLGVELIGDVPWLVELVAVG